MHSYDASSSKMLRMPYQKAAVVKQNTTVATKRAPDVLDIEENAANEDAKSEDDIKQNVKQEIMAAIEMCDSDDTDDLEESSELSSSEDETEDDKEERKDSAGRNKPRKKSSKHLNG